MDWLQELLGDELYGQVSAKIGNNEKVQLVNAKDGSYVPKSKLTDALNEGRTYKQQAADTQAQLETLRQQAAGNETLQGQIAALQKTIADKDKEMQRQALLSLVREGIQGYQPYDASVVLPLIDMNKVSQADGQVTGLREQMDALRKDKAFLFRNTPPESGGAPNPGGGIPAETNNQIINDAIRRASGRYAQ